MTRFNKRAIMLEAWRFYRDEAKRFGDFAQCLKTAWNNAKALNDAKTALGVTEEISTHYGWELKGRDVLHGEHAIIKVKLAGIRKDSDKTEFVKSYFAYSQTCELGTQPPKA